MLVAQGELLRQFRGTSLSTSKPISLNAARAVKQTAPAGITVKELLESGDSEVFRRLVESVHDYAIFLLTPGGEVASWNAGAERIKGYAADEIIGKHFSTFYTQDALDRGWPAEELRRAIADGHLEDEGWRVRKDGTQFWANVIISPVYGADDGLLGFSKVTRDLTERRAAESRLRESERNLRLLVESVQDYAIFQLTPTGHIASWNLGAERIKGYTAEEAIGKHFSIFYPADAILRKWPEEELRRAAKLGRFEDEGWRVRKDGTRIWANVVITALRDQSGQLVGFAKVTRDLTERRLHEEQLREREENLNLLVEGVKDHAMFLIDPQGSIKTWNSGAARLFGYRFEEAAGQSATMLLAAHEATGGYMQSQLASARAAGFSSSEGWYQRADGSRFWAETATNILKDENGRTKAFVQIVRDATESKRVTALENEGKRLGEFIAVLSHELRNPLAPILNAMAILQKLVGQQTEAKWCVDLVTRQVDHLRRLVEDLMDVSRVTSGKIRLAPVVIELSTLLRTACSASEHLMRDHQHVLRMDMPVRPVMVNADPTRLTQVITNLLSNAAKYTPNGGELRVVLTSSESHATVQVVDNGIGMSESMLVQAFDPFVQGVRGLDRSEGGMGIGLTLVKKIVELHGGAVSAASAGKDLGTTITFTLPLAEVEEEISASPPAIPGAKASGRKVLVVDDNQDAAETLAMMLRIYGHEVRVAYNGPDALTEAASMRPDVALMDIGLPGMTGIEAGERMRSLPGLSNLMLIAVTGYGQPRDLAATKEAGFDAHLTKPIEPAELNRRLSAIPSNQGQP